MIKVENIVKSFGELTVLKGIDLEIAKKEIVSIVGASGAGKTTLLQIIGTLSHADSGRILINNKDVFGLKEKALSQFRNLEIGFVFQFHQLLPEFTALENVCIPAFIAGANKKKAEAKAQKLLKFLKLDNRKTHKPNELSGGEQTTCCCCPRTYQQPIGVIGRRTLGQPRLEKQAGTTRIVLRPTG